MNITIPNDASFYLAAKMCYGTVCREIEIPWVREFALLPKNQDICILSAPFGKWVPGLYVRPDLKHWNLALSFNDVCELNLQANQITVLVYNQAEITYDNTHKVYRSSVPVANNTVGPSIYDLWVVVKLGSKAGSFVTKETPSSLAGVVQVSTVGMGTTDYIPPTNGFLIVDAFGVASVATPTDLEPLVDALPDAFE